MFIIIVKLDADVFFVAEEVVKALDEAYDVVKARQHKYFY